MIIKGGNMFRKLFGFNDKNKELVKEDIIDQETEGPISENIIEENVEDHEIPLEDDDSSNEACDDSIIADFEDFDDITNIDDDKLESQPAEEKEGLFTGFFKGLSKTRDNITNKIDSILAGAGKIDEDLFESLEDILIMADIGGNTTMEIVDRLKDRVRDKRISNPELIKEELNLLIKDLMLEDNLDNKVDTNKTPMIILIVGVNGVGKTTSIGKLAKKYKDEGKTVLLSAADTFRAAAIEQLEEWANRAGVDVISHSQNADPGAVVYDSIAAAKSRNTDILLVDTAGRLHNKKNLMNELNKIYRIIEKEYSEAHLETFMVLDATTGQNAMNQAKEFSEAANMTGVILTKMDGTAKGGVVIRLQSEMKLPVKYIGLGEGMYDLKEFDVVSFVDSIFS